MAANVKCPSCGGQLEARAVGALRDKHLACPFCGHRIDIADEYETSRIEEQVLPDGTKRRIEVRMRRRDLNHSPETGDPEPTAGAVADDDAHFEEFERLLAEHGIDRSIVREARAGAAQGGLGKEHVITKKVVEHRTWGGGNLGDDGDLKIHFISNDAGRWPLLAKWLGVLATIVAIAVIWRLFA